MQARRSGGPRHVYTEESRSMGCAHRGAAVQGMHGQKSSIHCKHAQRSGISPCACTVECHPWCVHTLKWRSMACMHRGLAVNGVHTQRSSSPRLLHTEVWRSLACMHRGVAVHSLHARRSIGLRRARTEERWSVACECRGAAVHGE